jgi:hypothetical protein
MENHLYRIEVSIGTDWSSHAPKFRRALKAGVNRLAADLAEDHAVELNRVQVIANPKKR